MSEDWTEKYRPKTLDGVIGNPAAVNQLRAWARSWEDGEPESRAVLLAGPPGIGKTTSAEALAREMGWGIVEMNASDKRRKADVEAIAGSGAITSTFGDDGSFLHSGSGKRTLIVMDEADAFLGNNDRGGNSAVGELIRTTKQPLILIANDSYALVSKNSAARKILKIDFRKPQKAAIAKALYKIAESEGVEVDPVAMEEIAENAGGDMRAAVRDLQSLAIGRDAVSGDLADTLSHRDVDKDIFGVVSGVLYAKTPDEAMNAIRSDVADPPTKMMWIDENLPVIYTDQGDLVRAYDKLSRSAIYLGRVGSRQYYGFWSYASEFMSYGLAASRMSDRVGRGRLNFPTFMTKLSRARGSRGVRSSLEMKAAIAMHSTPSRVGNDVLPYLSRIALKDKERRAEIIADLGLDEEEFGMLIGKKADSKDVKTAMADADALLAERAAERAASRPQVVEQPVFEHIPEPPRPAPAEPKAAEKPAPAKKPKGQLSLFDFR